MGDAGLVSSMGVDPLDRGSGVILGIISSKILDSVSIGDGGSVVNNGTMSSNHAGGSWADGTTGGVAGGMTGATGGAVGGATGGAGGTTGMGGAEAVGGGNGWG